jgi:hypothetical protein
MKVLKSVSRTAPVLLFVGLLLLPGELRAQASAQGESGLCEKCVNYGTCDTHCEDATLYGYINCTPSPCLGACSVSVECTVYAVSPDGSVVEPNGGPAADVTYVQLASLSTTAFHSRRQCDGTITQRAYAHDRARAILDAMLIIDLKG